MGIKFSLYKNSLSNDANQFRAVVQSAGTMDYEQIVERVVKQNSTVTRTDILAALNDFISAIEDALLLGYNVNTPLANFRAVIKGNFEGDTDSFTPGRNSVEASITSGLHLRKAMQQAQVQKQESGHNLPRPINYLDLNTGELNSQVTPGSMGQITGYRLKFDTGDPNQGIFFINGGSAGRVSLVGHNGPTKLMFMTPANLPPGDYILEIRSAMGNGTIHTGQLPVTLVVS